jgi:CheY-like chemotaxis protein
VIHVGEIARGRVVDVSAGGLRVQLQGHAPSDCLGARVGIDLRIDGAAAAWFRLYGRVGRVEADGTLAIAFLQVPADFEDALQSELVAVLESEATDRVLLVDPVPWRRARMAARLRASGCVVTEVSTPLEAIAHLGESRARPFAVAIADTIPENVAEELRAYIGEAHAELVLLPC